jgi:hypothetical protein
MRRFTPNSHFRFHAWFRQANGEVLLAEGKTTITFDSGDAASAFTPPVADHSPSLPSLPAKACSTLTPTPGALPGFLHPSRAFNPHSTVVGPRFSTTDF